MLGLFSETSKTGRGISGLAGVTALPINQGSNFYSAGYLFRASVHTGEREHPAVPAPLDSHALDLPGDNSDMRAQQICLKETLEGGAQLSPRIICKVSDKPRQDD